jgi:hypothetical protein
MRSPHSAKPGDSLATERPNQGDFDLSNRDNAKEQQPTVGAHERPGGYSRHLRVLELPVFAQPHA